MPLSASQVLLPSLHPAHPTRGDPMPGCLMHFGVEGPRAQPASVASQTPGAFPGVSEAPDKAAYRHTDKEKQEKKTYLLETFQVCPLSE